MNQILNTDFKNNNDFEKNSPLNSIIPRKINF